MKKLNSSGFMVLDVLVAAGLITVLMLPLMETTRIALTSGGIVKSQITQQDLHQVITKSLSDPSCHKNYTARDTNTNKAPALKFYENASSTGTKLLSKGKFKGSLEIVDMVFEDIIGTTNTKKLSIFYKILKVGSYSTKDNKNCDSTDTDGCYFNHCSFEYDSAAQTCNLLDCSSSSNNNTRSAKQCAVGSYMSSIDSNGNIVCSDALMDCSSNTVDDCQKIGFQWSCKDGYTGSCGYTCNTDNKWESSTPNTCVSIDCFTVEDDKTLIGCGGTADIAANITAIGYRAGINTTGTANTFIGNYAGFRNTTGFNNVFIGSHTGIENETGHYNTFIGYSSGFRNTTGNHNTFIGNGTGIENETGHHNTFIGDQAGEKNETGHNNTFIGYQAGAAKSTGNINTFIGNNAGQKNNGTYNTFIGNNAGQENETGHNNTFIGYQAGQKNNGTYNTFIGNNAGQENETGHNNIFIGYNAGYTHTGNSNVFIGNNAGYNDTTTPHTENNIIITAGTTTRQSGTVWALNDSPGNNNILIGSFSVEKEKELMSKNSNYVWIHDLIEGNNKEQWVAIKNSLETNNLYASLHTSSDKRLKTNIKELSRPLDTLNKLNAYSFEWNKKSLKPTDKKHIGFIAQEVKKVMPELVTKRQSWFFHY